MKIQNSPFHISKNSNNSFRELNFSKAKPEDPKVSESKLDNKENFSFWDWFRGLVNPLQNLPIISGIYSSINSDDSKSDRDLVQNSLGGFMYGGPIGAIAGFGNWVFNKLFDKTPSELALDATGISNLWKDDESLEKVARSDQALKDRKEVSENIVNNQRISWWNKSKINSSFLENSKIASNAKSNSEPIIEQKMGDLRNLQFSKISSRYSSNSVAEKNQIVGIKTKKLNSSPVTQIDKKAIISKVENIYKSKTRVSDNDDMGSKYRDLNFNYPAWNSEKLGLEKIINENPQDNQLKKKYLDIRTNEKLGSNLNMKL